MVEVFAAFSGGLISFLSPCVLPLVPGYISMLSGIGVEQLRQGQRPRNSLMASALAFTVGLSVVFIAFGASASAVGQFLKHNRSFLAPIAGALVFLFGLHLIGVLGKIKPVVGIVLGAILVGLALFAQMRPGVFGESLGSNQLVSLGMIPLLGPGLSRWLNRDLRFHNLGGEQKKESSSLAGIVSGFLMGFGFAFGWTPCVGVILTPILAFARLESQHQPRDVSCWLFIPCRPFHTIPARGAGTQPVSALLPEISALSQCGGNRQRRVIARYRFSDLHESTYLAFR